jgi:hypothetical protein
MIAFPDGTKAQVGDAVSLAHGEHTGIVQELIDSPGEISAWNLSEPSLIIDTSFGGLVFYSQDQITDDEIVLVSRSPA